MAVEVTLRESAVGDHGADLWRHLIVHHKIPYGYLVLYEKGTVLQLRIIQVVTRPYDEYVLPTGARVRPCSAHTQLRAARGTSRAMCLRRGAATAAGLSYCMSSRTGSLSYCMSSRIRVLDLSVVACQAVQPCHLDLSATARASSSWRQIYGYRHGGAIRPYLYDISAVDTY